MPLLSPPNLRSARSGVQARCMACIVAVHAQGVDKAESCGAALRQPVPWCGGGQLTTGHGRILEGRPRNRNALFAAGALMAPACFVFSGANSAMQRNASVPFIRRESLALADEAFDRYSRWASSIFRARKCRDADSSVTPLKEGSERPAHPPHRG